ncbi:unnamed protein product [Notodromas monacha]|uniref:O-acyltransferase WSD1 C-terminal domain-containing protein n=1 Tax=Notodromas monacha TaxID=399045 RepID=A0A7R9BD30_9CRUS|nr:unnamed protein product [Notodromas monacha]CAG0913078.1 unnamed protein product [Notodromas monacha]
MFRTFTDVVTHTLCFLVFFVTFIPSLLFSMLWKLIVRVLLYLEYGSNAELMAACDAVSAHKPAPSKEGLINALFHIRGSIPLKEIRRRVSENLVCAQTVDGRSLHPRLMRSVQSKYGLYVWTQAETFDLHWHVDYFRDEAGTKVTYKNREDQLDVIQKIINAPMFDSKTSPWRVLLVNKEDGSDCILILRCHHSMLDGGAAFMVVLPAVADQIKGSDGFGNIKPLPKVVRMRNEMLGMLCVPHIMSRQLCLSDDNPLRSAANAEEPPCGKWCYWSDPIPLAKVTEVRKKTNVRFSAVLITCIGRAVTRYLKLPEVAKTHKGNPMISAYQAVSMWTREDVPRMENKITGIASGITPNPSKNALEQLLEANENQEHWLRQEFLWGSYTFSNLTTNTVPHVIPEKFIIPWLLGGVTMFVSSAMGPSNFFTVNGNEVYSLTGIMPLPPTTCLGFILLSYGDKLAVSVTGRKYAFPELEDLKKLDTMLHEEFDILHKAIVAQD